MGSGVWPWGKRAEGLGFGVLGYGFDQIVVRCVSL